MQGLESRGSGVREGDGREPQEGTPGTWGGAEAPIPPLAVHPALSRTALWPHPSQVPRADCSPARCSGASW